MAVEVKMPQLGESVHEGTIGKWLKSVGDTVQKYEPLLEVITDKVDTEVTAADSGTVLAILVPEGETVKVGTVLAVIGAPGEKVEEVAGGGGQAAEVAGVAAAGVTTGGAQAAEVAAVGAAGAQAAEVAAVGAAAAGTWAEEAAAGARAEEAAAGAASGGMQAPAGAQAQVGASQPATQPVPAPAGGGASVSPVAARMAAEHGIDVSVIAGTGPGGQITRQDIERTIAAGPQTVAAAGAAVGAAGVAGAAGAPFAPPATAANGDIGFISPRVARLAAQYGVNLRAVPGTGRDGRVTARDVERFIAEGGVAAVQPSAPAAARAPSGVMAGELVKLTPMRAAIAEHMVRSKQTSPHVTTVHEVDMSAVMDAYQELKPQFAAKGVRLTLTAFVVRATAGALARHPMVNSSWTDAGIQTHRDINIGMAVAVPAGLIVPVIRNADEKNLLGLARDVNDLAERARTKKLSPDDVQGGTFTLTNYGTLGSLFGTPVINQPQAAILGTGAIKKQAVVIEAPGGDSIGIKPMMLMALTFDHRILEGSTADPFVQDIVHALESEQAL